MNEQEYLNQGISDNHDQLPRPSGRGEGGKDISGASAPYINGKEKNMGLKTNKPGNHFHPGLKARAINEYNVS